MGRNCLGYCNDTYRMSVCLQMGADANRSFRAGNFSTYFSWHIRVNGSKSLGLMLLSAGADPLDTKIPAGMKPQIRSWIEQIDTAKPCLELIFDDEILEQLLM